jgi:signal transduction histidine kinase
MRSAAENPGRVILLGGLTAGAVCAGLVWPLHATAVGARAGIETAIVLLALLSTLLLGSRFRRTRRLDDLLLAGVVATAGLAELAFAALPAVGGLDLLGTGNGAAAVVAAAASVAIVSLALAPPLGVIKRPRGRTPRRGASLFARLREPAGLGWEPARLGREPARPGREPARPGREPAGPATLLLAAGCLLLASAGLEGLASRQAADWVTPGTGLRLVAYAIVLAVALRRHVEMGEAVAAGALNTERKRLARDLHDGLAQDLAFIAVYAQGLEADLGPAQPLLVAARRALNASRGLMADLAARSAPTTGAALAIVADELGGRFGVQVEVRSAPVTALSGRPDLGPVEREEIVMIAREAIVNAITHGHAQRIEVTLDLEGERPLLLVSDDGGGITSGTPRVGFGLPTMRARAESLGARLVMRQGAGGGTELEVSVVPQAQA